MSVYRASADLFVNGLTYGLLVFLGAVALGFFVMAYYLPYWSMRSVFAAAAILCLSIPLLSYLYSPRSYALTSQSLIVRRPLSDVEIPFGSIRDVEKTAAWFGAAWKTLPGGNSGLFGIYGTFRNDDLGRFRMYATRASNAVIVHTDAETIVLTPDERDRFIEELRSRIHPISGTAAEKREGS